MIPLNKTAFIFPGQGSQSLGMLNDFSKNYSVITHTFAEASDSLGYNLWDVTQSDEQKLNQTHITQPAILTASVALWRLVQEEKPLQVAFMAGHSLGEYSALVCAGVLSLADAVKLVEMRGNFMQAAVPAGEGAMAAILGLDDDQVKAACDAAVKNKEEGEVASAVNFNSPGQVVIAGSKAAIDRAIQNCKEAGARKAMPLAVSVPSHCALMASAAKQLEEALSALTFNTPNVPVVNNVNVECVSEPQQIKQALITQLTDAVRWVESIQYIGSQGIESFIECGPGKVLTGLGKRIDKSLQYSALNTPDALSAFLETI
jgi:[acyl-carrier-protein] S-malonyltransferase